VCLATVVSMLIDIETPAAHPRLGHCCIPRVINDRRIPFVEVGLLMRFDVNEIAR
jgi:hypothetical protein